MRGLIVANRTVIGLSPWHASPAPTCTSTGAQGLQFEDGLLWGHYVPLA